MIMEHHVLYSFRRCPYAMRARMALAYSKVSYLHREILLRDRPQTLYDLSSKGTVPVLQLADGSVIDESVDIMKWALKRNDPEHWYKENFNHHKLSKQNTFFLNNGIDSDYYRRDNSFRNQLLIKHSISKSALNVGFVGEFKKIKGIDLLIEIIKEFKNNKNINFIICAGGDYLREEFDNEFSDCNNVFNLGGFFLVFRNTRFIYFF